MIDIEKITSQVKYNCNISDAQFWGYYSPCGLLLRMRDLYKIESGMKPWEAVNIKDIGTWMETREELWHELEDSEFQNIQVNSRAFKPFDVMGINAEIEKHGYVYGAGYGNFLKPLFILAKLTEKSERGRYGVYIAGQEKARDLSTSPAMIRGNTILLRHETMKMFFWGKFEEMGAIKHSGALYHAFSDYGISTGPKAEMPPEKIDQIISLITKEELSSYIHHEIGEASQRRVLGRWWKELLMELPYSRAELYIRALKDIMSDTCRSGMLAYIIENKKTGSLSFYVSLLSGYRKTIFPNILTAYRRFRETENWDIIEKARVEGYKKAGDSVRKLKEMVDKGRASAEVIEKEIIPS